MVILPVLAYPLNYRLLCAAHRPREISARCATSVTWRAMAWEPKHAAGLQHMLHQILPRDDADQLVTHATTDAAPLHDADVAHAEALEGLMHARDLPDRQPRSEPSGKLRWGPSRGTDTTTALRSSPNVWRLGAGRG